MALAHKGVLKGTIPLDHHKSVSQRGRPDGQVKLGDETLGRNTLQAPLGFSKYLIAVPIYSHRPNYFGLIMVREAEGGPTISGFVGYYLTHGGSADMGDVCNFLASRLVGYRSGRHRLAK